MIVQQVQLGGSVIFSGCGAPGVISISLPVLNPQSVRVDGAVLEENSALVLRPGKSFVCATQDVTRWVNVIVPIQGPCLPVEFTRAAEINAPVENSVATKMDVSDLCRLRSLIDHVLGETVANVATHTPGENRADAQFAVNSARELRTKSSLRRLGRRRLPRNRILTSVLAVIEESEDHRLRITDLCRVSGVSERTMRTIFMEHFGVAPMRFLQQHRLHKIHAALRRADPKHETVTQIAAKFGVWDFSSFARHYKSIYEEAPSATLHRSSFDAPADSGESWIYYALRKFNDGALQEHRGSNPLTMNHSQQ